MKITVTVEISPKCKVVQEVVEEKVTFKPGEFGIKGGNEVLDVPKRRSHKRVDNGK